MPFTHVKLSNKICILQIYQQKAFHCWHMFHLRVFGFNQDIKGGLREEQKKSITSYCMFFFQIFLNYIFFVESFILFSLNMIQILLQKKSKKGRGSGGMGGGVLTTLVFDFRQLFVLTYSLKGAPPSPFPLPIT